MMNTNFMLHYIVGKTYGTWPMPHLVLSQFKSFKINALCYQHFEDPGFEEDC
jgi:hypothetical protein